MSDAGRYRATGEPVHGPGGVFDVSAYVRALGVEAMMLEIEGRVTGGSVADGERDGEHRGGPEGVWDQAGGEGAGADPEV